MTLGVSLIGDEVTMVVEVFTVLVPAIEESKVGGIAAVRVKVLFSPIIEAPVSSVLPCNVRRYDGAKSQVYTAYCIQ